MVHRVMVVMVMVMVVVMMVVMVHLMRHRSGGGGRRGLLRNGVAGKTDGESGGGDKALDHGQIVLSRKIAAIFPIAS